MTYQESCKFCRIAAGLAPSDVVYDDDSVIAFLDARPLFPGHVLVTPKNHVGTLWELPDELVSPLMRVVRGASKVMLSAMNAEGSFVAVNNRVSQSVPHLHVHVVPRSKGDGLRGFFWPRVPYESDEHRERTARVLADALRAELGG